MIKGNKNSNSDSQNLSSTYTPVPSSDEIIEISGLEFEVSEPVSGLGRKVRSRFRSLTDSRDHIRLDSASDNSKTDKPNESESVRVKLIADRKIAKEISHAVSKIRNWHSDFPDTRHLIKDAINNNNVDGFNAGLDQLQENIDTYNKQKNNNHKFYRDELYKWYINDKPFIYALAESGSEALLQALCDNENFYPRTYFGKSAYYLRKGDIHRETYTGRENKNTEIYVIERYRYCTDKIENGELNGNRNWWCYPNSPVCFALACGNIGAARTFIRFGGNIEGGQSLLKNYSLHDLESMLQLFQEQQEEIRKEVLRFQRKAKQLKDDRYHIKREINVRLRLSEVAVAGTACESSLASLEKVIRQKKIEKLLIAGR